MASVITTQRTGTTGHAGNRWVIAVMGTVLQLSLGSVYAWSYFQKPLVEGYGWKNTEVAWAFSLAICFLGISAAVGGVCLPRFGPRKLAVTGSVCYGLRNPPAGWTPHEPPGVPGPLQRRDVTVGRAGNGPGSPFYGKRTRVTVT